MLLLNAEEIRRVFTMEEGVEVYSYTREELTPLFSRVASTWEKLGEKLTKELVEDLISRHAEK